MKPSRTCITLLLIVVLVAVLAVSATLASVTVSVKIPSTGSVSTTSSSPYNVTANSLSLADVQAAVNSVHAHGKGTVSLPAGVGVWNPASFTGGIGLTSYGGVNIIGAGIGKTIIEQTPANYLSAFTMIQADGSNGYPYIIANFTLQGYASSNDNIGTTGVYLWDSTDYRVCYMHVDNFTNGDIVACQIGGYLNRGLVDHCNITQTYGATNQTKMWGYGTIVWDENTAAWSSASSVIGQYGQDTMIIENCTFEYCRHCCDASQNGYFVARFCTFQNEVPENFGMVDFHCSGRGFEVYNCTFDGWGANGQGVWQRGGIGTVFNNTFNNCATGVALIEQSTIPGQSGWSQTAGTYADQINDTYVWNNTMVNSPSGAVAFSYATQTSVTDTQNVNYFLSARPNYTPLAYPFYLDVPLG